MTPQARGMGGGQKGSQDCHDVDDDQKFDDREARARRVLDGRH